MVSAAVPYSLEPHTLMQLHTLSHTHTHLGLRCRAVLVRATHVNAVVSPGAAVARVAIGGEHTANDVTEVWHVVHVRQRAGDLQSKVEYGSDDAQFGAFESRLGNVGLCCSRMAARW